jgi:anti-sigma regulatory factor (Ser/Thr protein kinase)
MTSACLATGAMGPIATQAEGATVLLPCEAHAPPQARRLALEVAGALMSEEQRQNLALAVSEVVTNAVRHSGAEEQIKLALTPEDGYLCVRVTDAGSGLVPRPGAMRDGGAGVGLFLVEQLTRRWGMTREGGRTRVWFEMDLPSDS